MSFVTYDHRLEESPQKKNNLAFIGNSSQKNTILQLSH